MRTPILIISALAISALAARAQAPTITNANNFTIGEVSNMITADTLSGVNPGPSGPNVTWDFSTLKDVSPKDSLLERFISVQNSRFAKDFPNADLASRSLTDDSTIIYYSFNNKFALYGIEAITGSIASGGPDTFKIVYDNPYTLYSYPITYNDNQKSAYTRTFYLFGDPVYTKGTVNTVADAYGTLKIMKKTYTNVLRIHITISSRDSFPGQAATPSTEEDYFYLTPGKKDPLLSLTLSKTGNSIAYNTDAKTLGIKIDQDDFATGAMLYPNPAQGKCTLSFNALSETRASISIINQLGQVVQNTGEKHIHEGNNTMDIDLASLPKGMYYVQISGADQKHVEKLMVN